MAGEDFDLAEIFRIHGDNIVGRVSKAFPGQVVSYDPATQCADVQPMLKRQLLDDDGNKVYESLPLLPAVPICFPRAGGYCITLPMAAGDFVWVNCSDASMAEWLATGQESEPWDTRKHGLSGAIAYPGVYPDTKPLASGDHSARVAGMVIGKDGGDEQIRIQPGVIQLGAAASDFVALSQKVLTVLQNIQSAFNTHMHPTAGTGSPSPPTIPMPAPSPVAASKVKAQ